MCRDITNPLEFTTALNTITVMASQCLDDDDLALAAAALTQIGDTLATIAVQREVCKLRASSCNGK